MSDDVKELQERRMVEMEEDIKEIRKRVFNGLSQELRKEMDKAVGGVRAMVIGVLISILLGLAGIIVEGRLSSASTSNENMRNYKAIVDLEDKLGDHMKSAP